MPLKLVAIGLVAGLFSSLFGVGGGIVIVPLLILVLRFDGGRDGDLAGRDRDHRARRHDPVRVRRPRRRRVRGPRRAARRRRCDGRRHDPAASLRSRPHNGFRRAPRRPRGLAARRMSATTIIGAVLLGFAAGVLAGFFGVGGGILFVPDPRRAGALAARRRGDLAARDPADRRRGYLASAALRQRALAERPCARARSIAGVGRASRSRRRCPEDTLRRLFALLLLGVAAQLAWRSRRPAPYPSEP